MPPTFRRLDEAARWLDAWLCEAALPLWSTLGVDAERGGFQEALTLEAAAWPAPRRSRVQTRQIWVFATAAAQGLGEAYSDAARRAFEIYLDRYARSDGLFVRAVDTEGRVTDPTAALYEQAFSLLAMSALGARKEAAELRTALESMRHASGGWREAGAHPFQANAHMHLLEAALAWEATGEGSFAAMSDEIAELALARFVEPGTGALREFFDAEWRALDDAEGGLLEPGHQFEWAWLLDRWGQARGREDARSAARRLYAAGLKGVDPERQVAVGALSSALTVREAATRLWAQTEFLKAAQIFGREEEAATAATGLARFLDTPVQGLWRDKMRADGGFVEEPAPATSLYHLVGAILPLRSLA